MKYLRQSTAAAVIVGPFLAKADGVTPVTSLTTGSTLNGRIVSNGTGAAYSPATMTHDANGFYLAALATGDIPSIGRFRLEFSDPATYLPIWEDFSVLSGAVYDSLFGSAALSTYSGGAVASVTAAVTVGINGDKTGYILASAGLDSIVIETGVNARQALSPILAASAGVLLGAGTGMIVVKGGNVTTTRITATTDNAGNRTAITLAIPS